MKLNPWYIAALGLVALLVTNSPLGAQIGVLGVTIGIFLGTLALRRPSARDATTSRH